MYELTLKEAWELCHQMWNDLPDPLPEGFDIMEFKEMWVEGEGYGNVIEGCFFCEYSKQQVSDCGSCPGCLIDPAFSCINTDYDYEVNPLAFRDKINELYLKFKKQL